MYELCFILDGGFGKCIMQLSRGFSIDGISMEYIHRLGWRLRIFGSESNIMIGSNINFGLNMRGILNATSIYRQPASNW